MASVQALALGDPLIPLVSEIDPESEVTVIVAHTVNTGTAAVPVMEKRKIELLKLDDSNVDEVEYILRVILEFQDAAGPQRFNLTNGPALYSTFRQVLSGVPRDDWDIIAANHPNTVQGFANAIDDFIGNYIMDTDLADQRRYLDTVRKPLKFKCPLLMGRLRMLNKLLSLFPGANNTAPYDDQALKYLFYKMMPNAWQIEFLKSGNELSDANYTLDRLSRYFTITEKASDKKRRDNERKQGSMNTPKKKRGADYSTSTPKKRSSSKVRRRFS